jgi:hypothetical protein
MASATGGAFADTFGKAFRKPFGKAGAKDLRFTFEKRKAPFGNPVMPYPPATRGRSTISFSGPIRSKSDSV